MSRYELVVETVKSTRSCITSCGYVRALTNLVMGEFKLCVVLQIQVQRYEVFMHSLTLFRQ